MTLNFHDSKLFNYMERNRKYYSKNWRRFYRIMTFVRMRREERYSYPDNLPQWEYIIQIGHHTPWRKPYFWSWRTKI